MLSLTRHWPVHPPTDQIAPDIVRTTLNPEWPEYALIAEVRFHHRRMLTTARSVPYVLRKEMRRAEKLNETAPLFKLQLQLNAPPSKRYLRGDSDAGHLLREPLEYQFIKIPRPATNTRCFR